MLKEHFVNSLKITIGVVIGTLLAKAFHMEFYTSVATIIIVSMLSAKKQSIKLALTRLLAALFSLALSTLLFTALGFTFPVFAIYILIFTFLMYKFDSKVAIVLNVVSVMHIYSLQEVSFAILVNEFELMFLGILVALVINSFILDIEDELIEYRKRVEYLLNNILNNMGRCLENECRTDEVSKDLDELDELLVKAKQRSYKHMNNYYVQANNYYVEYFSMRRKQYYTARYMENFIKLKFLEKKEVSLLKDFTDNLLNNTKELETCEAQTKKIDEIKYHFTNEAVLPPTLAQLQNRIALHQYLYSLQDLVLVKKRFIERYEKI